MIWERDPGLFERSLKEKRCGRTVAQEEQRRGHLPPRVGFCTFCKWDQTSSIPDRESTNVVPHTQIAILPLRNYPRKPQQMRPLPNLNSTYTNRQSVIHTFILCASIGGRHALQVDRSLEETAAGLRLKPPKTKYGRRVISLQPSVVTVLRAFASLWSLASRMQHAGIYAKDCHTRREVNACKALTP
jgi:hypothetical protein